MLSKDRLVVTAGVNFPPLESYGVCKNVTLNPYRVGGPGLAFNPMAGLNVIAPLEERAWLLFLRLQRELFQAAMTFSPIFLKLCTAYAPGRKSS